MGPNGKLLELRQNGYCVLRAHLPASAIDACRDAFWPRLLAWLEDHAHEPNRGPHRHFLPMPFDPPCFQPAFFFDPEILAIAGASFGPRIVADQWGCDVPLPGSEHQCAHVDYQRPLFEEASDLPLPPYMLVVSFGLHPIAPAHGPIEIAPATHSMPREQATRSVESGEIPLRPVPLGVGDVLIRHPWALHRGAPNLTDQSRALLTIRYLRRWYADSSREVRAIPRAVWNSLTPEQRELMRFPVEN
jgi:ectoine hydroxylase-related dioxygenase (phytanoyl-CoA dioxygenase family)